MLETQPEQGPGPRPGALTLRVDMRERSSAVVGALLGYEDLHLEFASLATADYLLSPCVAVERKSASDFLSSIIDRRLFRQAVHMRAHFERVVFLLEGDPLAVESGVAPEAIRGALSFLAVGQGVAVLQAADARDAAALLRVMARQAQEELGTCTVGLRARKPTPGALHAEYLVQGLPGIGRQMARVLLLHFGSAAALMRATPEQLREVHGIGKKRAEQIWSALNAPYTP